MLPPVATLARARLRALLASSAADHARQLESRWAESCPAYVEARAAPVEGASWIDVQGLRFAVPDEPTPRGLGARLREGWLPWHDVLNRWSLGLGGDAIDVGANIGSTAIVRVLAGAARRVYAVEADPQNYACLVQSVVANGLAGFVLPDACAVSDATGVGAWRRGDKMGNHHLVTASAPGSRHKTMPVETTSLDDWVAARGIEPARVSFVKVDVQGWESRVLSGAPALLAHRHIVWGIEVSPKHLELAGTPLPQLLEQIARHFTRAVDARRRNDPVDVRQPGALPELLAHVGPGTAESYANLLLFNHDTG